ncbi:hypothetical protein LQW54_007836 [Pestalotiopsis sp. IQ-011]
MTQGQATTYQDSTHESDTVERWTKLFGYTHAEAQDKIEQSRNHLNRTTITIGHWEMIRDEMEAEGHDKESYEHYLDISKRARYVPQHTSSRPGTALAKKPVRFLLKPDGPLSDITIIQQAGNSRPPKLREGTDDSGHPYFFYGTLADPDILTAQTGVEEPRLIPAHISGGVLKTWGGKYKALVDQRGYGKESKVAGHAFSVESEKVETGLRVCETDKYEVVRCTIEMGARREKGLTFRFVGDDALGQ